MMSSAGHPSHPTGLARLARLLVWGGALLVILAASGLLPQAAPRLRIAPGADRLALEVRPPRTGVGSVSPAAPAAPPVSQASEWVVRGWRVPSPGAEEGQADPTPAIPTRIRIPTLGVDAPVVATTWHTTTLGGEVQRTWEVPAAYAAGWHATSAPLGAGSNTVLNGHNTGHGEVFRDLYRLRPGDPVILYSGEQAFSYVVLQTLTLREAGQPVAVRQRNAEYILPTADERVTLVTCHPYGSLRDRLIVIAVPESAAAGGAAPGHGEEVERP